MRFATLLIYLKNNISENIKVRILKVFKVLLQILSWCSNHAFFLSNDKFLLINKVSFLDPKRFFILTLCRGPDIFIGTSRDKGCEVGTSEFGTWDCSGMPFLMRGRDDSWWPVVAACSWVGLAEDFPRLYSLFKLSCSFWLIERVLGLFPVGMAHLVRLFHVCLPSANHSLRISTFDDIFEGIIEVL